MHAGGWSRVGGDRALKRRVDIVEARLLVLLCALVVACAAVFGVIDAMAALHHEQSVAEQQRATRHPVRAEILRDAAEVSPWTDESGRSERVPVPVRWSGTDGSDVTADARVSPARNAGSAWRCGWTGRAEPPRHLPTPGTCGRRPWWEGWGASRSRSEPAP